MADAPLTLTTPVADLPGVRRDDAAALGAMGLWRLGHLLAHLPARHELIEPESPINLLAPDHLIATRGEITATRLVGRYGRQRFEAVLCDTTGRLDLVWFNAPYLQRKIQPGHVLRVQGKLRKHGSKLQLANPEFEFLADDAPPSANQAQLRPIYPASERIGSRRIERIIASVLDDGLALLDDHLPPAFRTEHELPTLAQAYRMMHRPSDEQDIRDAHRRLAYDELLMLQLGVHMKRAHLRGTMRAPALRLTPTIDEHIRARFPFALTEAQNRVVGQIAADLASSIPTNRLIQGDVGSGKTVVALYAMLQAVASGHQAALMAPTELLAEQHASSIGAMLAGSSVRTCLLTGATPRADRPEILERLAAGDIDLVIGTHALLTESVVFKSLAVAIVDEQHRFGVHQRATMRAKADDERSTPHMLVMTATPIPRSLALTLFGDLDVSVISELPPGRKPIATRVVTPDQRPEVDAFVAQRIAAGEQAFVVTPAIDPAETGIADVHSTMDRLTQGPLAGRRVEAMHGRLARAQRERIMDRFRAGDIDALVATTVIEVGVDVPGATVMVVENAERFGLAQLHQLRGRIGRSERKSVCVLVGEPTTDEGRQRLEVMASVADGFQLAERDLEIRGPGEVFGTRQSGLPPLRVADLMRDRLLLAMARKDAAAWIDRSPTLGAPEEALLRTRLLKRYGEALGLGDVG